MVKRVLIRDPRLPWSGAEAYEHLARRLLSGGAKPISPDSTAQEINDCFYDLQGAGPPDPLDRTAWDDLRRSQSRLLIDFMHYDLPEPDLAIVAAKLAAVELPVYFPDFNQLADVGVDFSTLPAPTVELPDIDPPSPAVGKAIKVDIGPLDIDLMALLGDEDE